MDTKNNSEWMYGGMVRSRWCVDDRTFAAIIYDNKIPAYDIHHERLDAEEALHSFIEDQKFRKEDIENFEIENKDLFKNNADLAERIMDAKASRELGQLRREKEKWDASINVAVKIGVYCHEQNKELTRKEIWEYVIHIDKNLPDTTIEKIWKAIPEQFRSKGGRPQKT